jgi:hypothetical protein
MNVATAIRYGVNGFVARDGQGKNGTLLKRADAIKAAFNDFPILSPKQAVKIAEYAVVRWNARNP